MTGAGEKYLPLLLSLLLPLTSEAHLGRALGTGQCRAGQIDVELEQLVAHLVRVIGDGVALEKDEHVGQNEHAHIDAHAHLVPGQPRVTGAVMGRTLAPIIDTQAIAVESAICFGQSDLFGWPGRV